MPLLNFFSKMESTLTLREKAREYHEKGILCFSANLTAKINGSTVSKEYSQMPKWTDMEFYNVSSTHVKENHNALLGICDKSGILVLDIDNETHFESLLRMCDHEIPLGCPIQKTPRGRHIFFKEHNEIESSMTKCFKLDNVPLSIDI